MQIFFIVLRLVNLLRKNQLFHLAPIFLLLLRYLLLLLVELILHALDLLEGELLLCAGERWRNVRRVVLLVKHLVFDVSH